MNIGEAAHQQKSEDPFKLRATMQRDLILRSGMKPEVWVDTYAKKFHEVYDSSLSPEEHEKRVQGETIH